ncbi:hypothetical protein CBW16_12375 [Flavobacteriaceae bacterium JJC]|nr:hypothetical protein CBW16_12375 [Flavobacteriaceae bacterium JJC]
MKIEIQGNEISILSLGATQEDHGVVKREVNFEIKGTPFQRYIILGMNGTGADYHDPQHFYRMNKDQVDASLIEYLSENHLYETGEDKVI